MDNNLKFYFLGNKLYGITVQGLFGKSNKDNGFLKK